MKVISGIADFVVGFLGATGRVVAIILAIIGALLTVAIGGATGMKIVIAIAAIYVATKVIRKLR